MCAAAFAGCMSEPAQKVRKKTAWYSASASSPAIILLSGGVRVRLIGVEAPHASLRGEHPFRKTACTLMQNYLKGRSVHVVPGKRAIDSFGTTLAYVYVRDRDPATGEPAQVFLNALVLERGWARFRAENTNKAHELELREAQGRARVKKAGIWKFANSSPPG